MLLSSEHTLFSSIEKIKSFETDKKTGYKVVKFGKYETSIGTTEPMEWLILDKDSYSYLLINRYVILSNMLSLYIAVYCFFFNRDYFIHVISFTCIFISHLAVLDNKIVS